MYTNQYFCSIMLHSFVLWIHLAVSDLPGSFMLSAGPTSDPLELPSDPLGPLSAFIDQKTFSSRAYRWLLLRLLKTALFINAYNTNYDLCVQASTSTKDKYPEQVNEYRLIGFKASHPQNPWMFLRAY